MKKLYEIIKASITKDREGEGDTRSLSILLRLLSIVCIAHYLAMIFPIARTGNIYMSLFLIFTIGILLGSIICTYEGKTLHGLWVYISIILLNSVLLSFFVGWGYFFIPVVFSTILLVFFTLKIPLKIKLFYIFFCYFIILVLGLGNLFLPLHTKPSLKIEFTLLAINISLTFLSFAMIAYAFYLKYMRSEEKIIKYNQKLVKLVNTDALTTLWNRRAMNEHLSVLVNQANKHQSDFTVAIMDIDFFKKVNDEYGHGMGDYVLKSLSYLLKTFMENKGHVARWGGEEFLITFENMDYETAVGYMEELRSKIEAQIFSFKDVNLHLTITAGIEEYLLTSDLDHTLSNADEKLYRGKSTGRNKVVSSHSVS